MKEIIKYNFLLLLAFHMIFVGITIMFYGITDGFTLYKFILGFYIMFAGLFNLIYLGLK